MATKPEKNAINTQKPVQWFTKHLNRLLNTEKNSRIHIMMKSKSWIEMNQDLGQKKRLTEEKGETMSL